MPEGVDENQSQAEVIGSFKTPDGEDAEVVKLAKDANAVSDDMIRPFAEALTETDFKDSVFVEGEDSENLREVVVNKKIEDIKKMISEGKALFIKIGEKLVAVQGMTEKTKMPNGRPLIEFTKGVTLEEYEKKGFAKVLFFYNLQAAQSDKQDAIFIGYSRNQSVISAFNKYGWHIVDSDSSHPIARTYNKDTDKETLKKLTRDGYKVMYYDPKNEIQPDDKMEADDMIGKARSRIRKLFSWK